MTTKQGVSLASRVLSVYFLSLAVSRSVEVASLIGSLLRLHSMERRYASYIPYFPNLPVIGAVIVFLVELVMAFLFYRCGPGVARFLLGEEISPTEESARNEEGAARA